MLGVLSEANLKGLIGNSPLVVIDEAHWIGNIPLSFRYAYPDSDHAVITPKNFDGFLGLV